MRSDTDRLRDILQAIAQIQQYGEEPSFERESLVQSGILYQLIIIGEAVGGLSFSLREAYPEIPWSKIVGMRNIIAHQYYKINLPKIWSVVTQNLPELKRKVEEILQELESPE